MIKAILFDLDGTLLPMDMEVFLKKYFERVTQATAHLLPPQQMAKHILDATMAAIDNTDPSKYNVEVFIEKFEQRTGLDRNLLMPIFDEFYEKEFHSLGRDFPPHPLVPEIIDLCKERGFRLVLATSPIFPKKAILVRMDWAGLVPEDFELITTYDNMHATKPHREYYGEILERLGLEAEECVMVGNDAEEDLVASKFGMKVFWLKDYAIHRSQEKPHFDGGGSYQDLYDWLSALPAVGEGDDGV